MFTLKGKGKRRAAQPASSDLTSLGKSAIRAVWLAPAPLVPFVFQLSGWALAGALVLIVVAWLVIIRVVTIIANSCVVSNQP